LGAIVIDPDMVIDPEMVSPEIVDSSTFGTGTDKHMGTMLAVSLVLYVAVGLVVGLAFVIYGITRVQAAPVTIGARILLLPGATALWPLVIFRWLDKSRGR
jgi:hypothetical protein